MRVLVILLAGLLSVAAFLTGNADAQTTYSFSWYSQVTGRDSEGAIFTGTIAGRGTARLSLTPNLVIIDFDTPLGPAHIEIQRDFLAFAPNTRVPFDVPPPIAFDEGGRALYESDYVANASSGIASSPPPMSFTVGVTQPGSGPSPDYRFVGTGTLQPFTAWLTSPPDDATVTGTVTVGMLGHGGTGTNRTYRLSVDDQLVSTQQVTNGGTASFPLNTATLTNGSHTLVLTVVDEAGATASDQRTVTVANATGTSVTFNLAENQTIRGSVAVQITANGLASGTKRFYLSVDGTQVSYWVVGTNTVTWWWNTRNFTNGTHRLSVRVVDANGREATGSVNVLIQN